MRYRYIYQSKLGKACFQRDVAYGAYKNLPRKMTPDKVLGNKSFVVGSNPKYDGYQQGVASMIYKFFGKHLETLLFTIEQK